MKQILESPKKRDRSNVTAYKRKQSCPCPSFDLTLPDWPSCLQAANYARLYFPGPSFAFQQRTPSFDLSLSFLSRPHLTCPSHFSLSLPNSVCPSSDLSPTFHFAFQPAHAHHLTCPSFFFPSTRLRWASARWSSRSKSTLRKVGTRCNRT
jgi:hypothetical protein